MNKILYHPIIEPVKQNEVLPSMTDAANTDKLDDGD